MNTLQDYADKINATARKSGFWDKERNFGEMLMLATSELAEALEEHRDGRDAVYFKCRTCGHLATDPDYARAPYAHYVPQPEGSFIERLLVKVGWRAHIECPTMEPHKPEGTAFEIMDCIIRCLDTLANELDNWPYTVDEIAQIKMDYNAQRERMHGKAY